MGMSSPSSAPRHPVSTPAEIRLKPVAKALRRSSDARSRLKCMLSRCGSVFSAASVPSMIGWKRWKLQPCISAMSRYEPPAR